MKHIVYVIINDTNNKCYVGYTGKKFSIRWGWHCYSSEKEHRPLSRAIKRDSETSFRFTTVGENLSLQEAKDLEKLWILTLRSFDRKCGYNLTLGGDGLSNPSESTRLKMSASHKGVPQPKSVIDKRRLSIMKTWQRKRKERQPGAFLCSEKEAARLKSMARQAALARWSCKKQQLLPPVSLEQKIESN